MNLINSKVRCYIYRVGKTNILAVKCNSSFDYKLRGTYSKNDYTQELSNFHYLYFFKRR